MKIKIKIKTLAFIIASIPLWGAFSIVSYACSTIGNLEESHHHGPKTVCLGRSPHLKTEQLNHFFDYHLEENTKVLMLRGQENLNREHLLKLVSDRKSSTIIELNLMNTNITYEDIGVLWKSKIFGSVRDDEPVYARYYNLPVSVVRIEIGHTPALAQYCKILQEQNRKIFPLPLHQSFDINYTRAVNGTVKMSGFKEFILMNHGQILQ